MTAPPAPASAPPANEGAGLSRQTIVTISSIGGGLLAAGLFLSAAMPPGGPMMAVVTLAFAGAVTLFVGAILGAISSRFSSGARLGFGLGGLLAFLMLLFVILVGPAQAAQTTPICGVAAAGPGLFALRSFTLMRDAGL